jgi:hypothetical protein
MSGPFAGQTLIQQFAAYFVAVMLAAASAVLGAVYALVTGARAQ